LEENWQLPFPGDPDRTTTCRLVTPSGDGPWPWVLVVHGYTSHGDWGFFPELSRRLVDRAIATVRVSLSGSALGPDRRSLAAPEVFARNTYTDELEELARVAARAARHPLLSDRRAVLGHSRGGAMGLVHAAETGGYRACVGWAAMDSILRFSPQRLEQWRRDGFLEVRHFGSGSTARLERSVLDDAERHRARLDPLAACARLEAAWLFLVGDRDRSVPPEDGARLAAAMPPGRGRCVVVRDADHAFGARDPIREVPDALEQLWSTTTAFLAEQLGGTRAHCEG